MMEYYGETNQKPRRFFGKQVYLKALSEDRFPQDESFGEIELRHDFEKQIQAGYRGGGRQLRVDVERAFWKLGAPKHRIDQYVYDLEFYEEEHYQETQEQMIQRHLNELSQVQRTVRSCIQCNATGKEKDLFHERKTPTKVFCGRECQIAYHNK